MTKQHESLGHSERPSAPVAERDVSFTGAHVSADILPTLDTAGALAVTAKADDAPLADATPDITADSVPGTALSDTPYIDAHGFDPDEFHWVPVRRRARKDGWSEAKQRLFVGELADSACVETAARAVQMSVQSAYALRRAPGGEAFAAAWAAAVQQGAHKLADVAFQRALHGTEEPVFDRNGSVVGHKTRYSERLMIFLMRAHLPERYGNVHRTDRPGDAPLAPPPPPPPPIAEAIALLEPACPDEPDESMTPDELDVALQVADIMDGELPERFQPLPKATAQMPLGEEFERQLESAKRGEPMGPDGQQVEAADRLAGKGGSRRGVESGVESGAGRGEACGGRAGSRSRARKRSGPKLP